MMKILLGSVIHLLFLLSFLQAEDPIKVSFEDLKSLSSNQEIVIRGFLYKSADHRWILASEPNVKSCCIGHSHLAEKQITLDGEFNEYEISQVIEVKGIWQHHPSYKLFQAQLVPTKRPYAQLMAIFLGFMMLVAFIGFLRRKRVC
jgi:hypothetical protein